MEVYQQIQQSIKKQTPLYPIIQELYSTLLPRRKFKSNGLTQQQCLSLVYEHIRSPLEKIVGTIQQMGIQQQDEENFNDNGQMQQQNIQQNQDQQADQDEDDEGEIVDENGDIEQNNEQYEQNENQQYDGNMQDGQQQQNDNPSEKISEQDIGLYGQQLDQQDIQSYQNQQMQDDPQFGNFNLNKMSHTNKNNQQNNQDEYIQDNFDQFRQIQLQNQNIAKKQQNNTEIQKQIQRLQKKAMNNKNWMLIGQAKAKERPVNSLIDTQLEYKSGIKYTHEITQSYNITLQGIIKQRILDEIFDDRVRIIPNTSLFKKKWQNVSTEKSSKGLAQLYEIEFKNSLGLGDNKNQKLKKQIMDSFKEVNYYLDSLSNTGFTFKPAAKIQKNGAQAIILEDKVPVTNWNGVSQAQKTKLTFQADKQVDKKTKRLRNKRNARQRNKQIFQKKMNKSIQYSGMTKIQAEARKKIAKTKKTGLQIKYNKSSSFFSNINNKNKADKPNPNISKLKV